MTGCSNPLFFYTSKGVKVCANIKLLFWCGGRYILGILRKIHFPANHRCDLTSRCPNYFTLLLSQQRLKPTVTQKPSASFVSEEVCFCRCYYSSVDGWVTHCGGERRYRGWGRTQRRRWGLPHLCGAILVCVCVCGLREGWQKWSVGPRER